MMLMMIINKQKNLLASKNRKRVVEDHLIEIDKWEITFKQRRAVVEQVAKMERRDVQYFENNHYNVR